MISQKPYLVRAMHHWCVDNDYTPHIIVEVDQYTQVPQEYVRDNQIVFNISASAVKYLQLDNDEVTFEAKFGGISENVKVPIGNIVVVFAKENNIGMKFPYEKLKNLPNNGLKLIK